MRIPIHDRLTESARGLRATADDVDSAACEARDMAERVAAFEELIRESVPKMRSATAPGMFLVVREFIEQAECIMPELSCPSA